MANLSTPVRKQQVAYKLGGDWRYVKGPWSCHGHAHGPYPDRTKHAYVVGIRTMAQPFVLYDVRYVSLFRLFRHQRIRTHLLEAGRSQRRVSCGEGFPARLDKLRTQRTKPRGKKHGQNKVCPKGSNSVRQVRTPALQPVDLRSTPGDSPAADWVRTPLLPSIPGW